MRISTTILYIFFSIISYCASASVLAPLNDECINATQLSVGTTCNYTVSTNAGATASIGIPAPGCANYSGGDVWFSAIVPASGSIIFDSNTGGITDGGMALYTGTCGALTLVACDDDGSANGLMPSISQTGLSPGTTVYIRFWGYGNNNTGTFSICVKEGISCTASSSNSSCATADPFCSGVSYDYCNTTNVASIGQGLSNTNAGYNPIYGCLGSTPNPAYYFLNVSTAGPITFNISQQTYAGVGIDVDYIVWGPFASQAAMCNGLAANNIVSCSYSIASVETAALPNAQAGQWYMVLITNFSNQPGVINFSQTNTAGSGTTNCNIITAVPGVCSGGYFTLNGSITVPAPPSTGTLTITNSCGGSQVINAPFNPQINYSIPNICGNGGSCNLSAVFSQAGAPTILPTSYTAPSCNSLIVSPGICNGSNQYVLSGTLTTGCLPTTGTLTITNSCGGSVVFNAPFTSILNWSLPASSGNGGSCTVTAVYSAASAPIITPVTFNEPTCCGANAGTVNVTLTNGGVSSTLANGNIQVALCPGGSVNIATNNNFILPTAGCAT